MKNIRSLEDGKHIGEWVTELTAEKLKADFLQRRKAIQFCPKEETGGTRSL